MTLWILLHDLSESDESFIVHRPHECVIVLTHLKPQRLYARTYTYGH